MIFCGAVSAQPQVIAHRGYHATEGSARNSIASLKKAQELNIYGSECDVNMTSDGEILVCHGGKHPDKGIHKNEATYIDIQKSTKAEVQALKLENGETMPTLDEYLSQLKQEKSTRLIIEIKSHRTPQLETECIEKTVAAVAKFGLEDQVEYICFRPWCCMECLRLAPKGTHIAYLNGDYDPEYVAGMGVDGIDYSYKLLMKKPKWIKKAHKLGLKVNTWTVDNEADIKWCIEHGVDYITTDNPVLTKKLIAEAAAK